MTVNFNLSPLQKNATHFEFSSKKAQNNFNPLPPTQAPYKTNP